MKIRSNSELDPTKDQTLIGEVRGHVQDTILLLQMFARGYPLRPARLIDVVVAAAYKSRDGVEANPAMNTSTPQGYSANVETGSAYD